MITERNTSYISTIKLFDITALIKLQRLLFLDLWAHPISIWDEQHGTTIKLFKLLRSVCFHKVSGVCIVYIPLSSNGPLSLVILLFTFKVASTLSVFFTHLSNSGISMEKCWFCTKNCRGILIEISLAWLLVFQIY